ncbi:MAG: spermine synthase [Spirochaetaceae bacterium]|nr:MAG: spermine synthase [Spirochaetaceae bacterium]
MADSDRRLGVTASRSGFRMTWAAGVMGFSGLLAQQLLLRELLIVFAGNELTIGLILACWLATEAAGSIWARRARIGGFAGTESPSNPTDTVALRHFMRVTLLFCLSLFPAIYAVRLIKPALGISVGTVAGLGSAAAASLIVLAPVSVTHGAMFTLGCSVCSRRSAEQGLIAGRPPAAHIYILETIGTLIAGVLWTAALIRLSDPFHIAVGIVLLNGLTVLILAGRLDAGPLRWRTAAGVLIAASLLLAAAGGTELLQHRSLNTLWRHQNIIHYENTMHGNIVITENQGQYTFFTDGTPAFLIPVPDIGLVEPLVHIPMTAHPEPRRILLIGGGAGGFVDAILTHPSVRKVEYLELDSRLLQLQRDLATASTKEALNDPRVDLRATDTRLWLTAGGPADGIASGYDVIFSRHHDPDNLESSRFFSEEFFRLAADNLTEQGILVLGFPGLVGHLNEPLQHLASGVHHSLEQVFPTVRAFPGDGQSFLLASADSAIADFSIDDFARRLRERELFDEVTLPWHVEQRLHPRWQPWFEGFAGGGSRRPIRDFQPRALFLSVAHWSSLNAPRTARVLNAIATWNPVLMALVVPAALLLPAVGLNRFSPGRRTRVIPAVLTTGFTAMVVNLSLMFAFQIVAGRLFGWLGLLTAAFIAGLGLGAMYGSHRLHRTGDADGSARGLLIQTDIVVLLFSGLLLILLPAAAPRFAVWLPPTLIRVLFFPVLLTAGAVCGAQFPVACSVLANAENGSDGFRRPAADPSGSGLVYAADLLGGCVGGILGGIVLLPLLGLAGTGVTIILVKAITVVMLIHTPKPIALEVRP